MKPDLISETPMPDDTQKMLQAAYAKLKAIKNQQSEPIAIVGMSCRFPKAADLASFWDLLYANGDATSKISKERYDIDAYYFGKNDSRNKIASPYSGGIDDVFSFDAGFFDISPNEALSLDPQQRLLLESAVEALENANLPTDRLSHVNTSVFVAISSFDYGSRLQQNENTISTYLGTGTLLSPAAGRISYSLNLKGPSMVVDTACSSSLVAIHQAIQSLRNRESDVSLVGGVGLLLDPNLSICFSKAQMLSPDGKCKTFDEDANGYVRGEGCAVVVLKRFSDAVANHDNVLAVICGSAVNQDGASGGLTIPSGPSQETVIKRALQNASIDPQAVDYIETHGTGTPLGDPIEVNAIGAVFASKDAHVKIGSVKTNIGHLEAVSGLASLVKVVLALQNECIPASLHFNKPNANIAWNDLNVEVVQSNAPWKKSDRRRVAGISSFGFSGTNAHIIVAESPVDKTLGTRPNAENFRVNGDRNFLLTVSAKCHASLLGNCKKLEHFLLKTINDENTRADHQRLLEAICFTSAVGRTHYKERLAFIAKSPEDLIQKLSFVRVSMEENVSIQENAGLEGVCLPNRHEYDHDLKFSFIFKDFYKTNIEELITLYNNFKQYSYVQEIVKTCRNIATRNNWVSDVVWDSFCEAVDTAHCEPFKEELCLVALSVQIAVAKFLQSVGLQPKIVVGYGMGEYSAACLAEIISVEEALYAVHQCCVLLDKQKKGNGTYEAILQQFQNALQNLTFKKSSRVQFLGTVSGDVKPSTPDYWMRHFEQLITYDTSRAIQALSFMLPDHAPSTYGISIGNSVAHDEFSSVCASSFYKLFPLVNDSCNSSSGDSIKAESTLLHLIGYMYAQGYSLFLDKLYRNDTDKINIPTYFWNRENYMLETKQNRHPVDANRVDAPYAIVRDTLPMSSQQTRVLESPIDLDKLNYIRDHQIFGKIVFPESTFIEMLFEAGTIIHKNAGHSYGFFIQDMTLHQPYLFDNDQTFVKMQVVCTQLSEHSYKAEIMSVSDVSDDIAESAQSRLHVSGLFLFHTNAENPQSNQQTLLDIRKQFDTQNEQSAIDMEAFYQTFMETGVHYGPRFRTVKEAIATHDQIVGRLVKEVETCDQNHNFCIDPTVMDGCLQLISAIQGKDKDHTSYFIMSIDSLQYYAPVVDPVWCHITKAHNTGSAMFPVFDLTLWDENGTLLAHIKSLRIQRADKDTFLSNQSHNWFYSIDWQKMDVDFALSSPKTEHTLGTWLVVSNGEDALAPLQMKLKQQGQNVITAVSNKTSTAQKGADYCIDFGSLSDFESLLKDVRQKNADKAPLKGVIFTGHSGSNDAYTMVDASMELCLGLLYLVQALTKGSTIQVPRLCILTQNAQFVCEDDHIFHPEQGSLWGMGRVLVLERPEFKPVFIDCDTHVIDDALLSDIVLPQDEQQVAYRKSQRYVARLQNAYSVPRVAAPIVDKDAAYLITGGFGSLGRQVAQRLVTRGARHLILVSRSGATTKSAQDFVHFLEHKGVTLYVLAVDIAQMNLDENDVFKAIDLKVPIRGVIHTAGVLDDKLIANQTHESFAAVLGSKVQGTWNLHQLTKNQPLDFFVCFSSMTSVIGAVGQLNYAAANAFMDVFCQYRKNTLGLPAMSISWGPWSDTHMAANKELEKHWAKIGMGSLGLEEGMTIFERMLSLNSVHLGVMPMDWSKYPDQSHFFRQLKRVERQSEIGEKQSALLRDLQKAEPAQRKKMLIRYVEAQICLILGYKEGRSFEENQGFFELGMNSLTSVEFKNNLQDSLECQLSSTITFDYPTIAKLVNYLESEIIHVSEEEHESQQKITLESFDDDNDADAMFKKLSQQLGL